MLDLKEAAESYLAERKKAFAHDRSLTVGASEIGQCSRRVWYEKKLGEAAYNPEYKPAAGAAFRGDILEDHFTVEVVKHAIKTQVLAHSPQARLIWAGHGQQYTVQALEWKLSATPDGLIINAPRNLLARYGVEDILGSCVIVEMKSFDPRIGDTLPKQVHLDQANVQLGLIRQEGTYAPAWAIVVYVNASFPDDIRVYPVFHNKLAFEDQIRRALMIMGANHGQQLRPEGKVAGGKECQHCPFAHICLGYVPDVPNSQKDFEKLPAGKAADIRGLVNQMVKRRETAKIYELEADQLEAELKEQLIAAKTRRGKGSLIDGRKFTIEWNTTRGRTIWDSEKLDALIDQLGYDPDTFQKETKPTERLTVRVFPKEEVKP